MVTKQKQLEYAAKHIEKWKSGYDYAVIEETTDGHLYIRWPSICTSGVTKKEWQQERDKMQKTDAINDMPPVAMPISVGKHVNAHELQKVIIQNRAAATIAATNTGDSEMTINAQDNSWHERGEFPPGGTLCDIRVAPNYWIDKVEIVHSKTGQGVVVKLMPSTDVETYLSAVSHNIDFRPLRTDREKAIDEMIEIICAGGELSKDGSAARDIAERIYEAQQAKEQEK